VPLELALSFLITGQSRSHEFEADRFGHSLGYGSLLQSALIKLHAKNAALVPPDRLYSAMHYSHPPLSERIQALRALDSKGK
jgi:Zn-dependent protease with chaperone function